MTGNEYIDICKRLDAVDVKLQALLDALTEDDGGVLADDVDADPDYRGLDAR